VEKPNASSGLNKETRRKTDLHLVNARTKTARETSHFETHCHAGPLQTGVPASFIAQVLGQFLQPQRAAPQPSVDLYRKAARLNAAKSEARWSERA
jgi:hypothetical protein